MRTNEFANQIKDRVDISQALEHYGFVPNKSGFIVCPFHKEDTASLKIYPATNTFHCFGCGVSGDVISFVRKFHNLDFGQALIRLDEDFHLNLFQTAPSPAQKAQMQKGALKRASERRERYFLEYWYQELYRAITAKFRLLWQSREDPKVIGEMEYLEWWLEENITFEKWEANGGFESK